MLPNHLAIHHHAVAYQAPDGGIWLPSFIGRWVDALAPHFNTISLLLHHSREQSLRQDTCLSCENVRLVSLGPPGRYLDHLARVNFIRKQIERHRHEFDALLVRGVTPRQKLVWEQLALPRRAFLLVGIPPQSRRFTPLNLLVQVMATRRMRELAGIARSGVMLVNSPGLQPEVQRLFGVQAEFVPTNTIRLAEYVDRSTLQNRKVHQPLRMLYCGRLQRAKGIPEILDAARILKDAGLKFRLDFVGYPAEGDRLEDFQQMAQRCGVQDDITWHGQLPFGERLLGFYRDADVFLLPTRLSEGFPHAIWEAAASGCAVVTTPSGGIPLLFRADEHGLMVPPGDAAALAQAVLRLANDEPLRLRLVRSAYEHALDFSVEACTQRLAGVLTGVWR